MTDTTEALPPLPEKRWAGFCSKCHSTTQFQKRPNTKAAPCGRCGYATFCEELDYSDDEMRNYARAALAQRQQVPEQRAWLVEWRFNGVQWLYLWPSAPGGFSFTSDASKALRFARREDAEAALQWARDTDAARRPIGSLTGHGLALGEMLVTEHDWPALTAAPSAQVEPSDDWQHLKQYGYAPGGYMSKCHRCGATPIMDKLAVTCRPCAETMHNEAKGL